MIGRTGALLVLAATAWAVGGVVAVESHWHPFGRGHSHDGEEVRVFAHGPGTHVRHSVAIRRPGIAVHLTPSERGMLPPGLAAELAEEALSAIASRELAERTVSHADIIPGNRNAMSSEQIVSVTLKSHPEFNLGILWPGVAARLEAAGHLPRRQQWPAESVMHVRPARRPSR